jgi:HEAT repeat protein
MTVPADPALTRLLERATAEAQSGAARENSVFWSSVAEAARAVPADEVLAVAITFCGSAEPAMRATGAALAGELSNGREPVAEALGVLGPLLAGEDDADVVEVALHAVALTGLQPGVEIALPFASHADAAVRLDATHALYSCAGDPPSQQAVAALIRLAGDPSDDVRDWATFGLGTRVDSDAEPVTDALAERLGDGYLDVREEAAVGLARRGDARAFETVRTLLEADEVSALTVEAAGYLGDERFLRPLLELGEWWEDQPELLHLAIARCDPAARARLDERIGATIDAIERGFAVRHPELLLDVIGSGRARFDLTTDLTLEWWDAEGNRRDATWSVEDLLARRDVQDDPERAAASVLAQLGEAPER